MSANPDIPPQTRLFQVTMKTLEQDPKLVLKRIAMAKTPKQAIADVLDRDDEGWFFTAWCTVDCATAIHRRQRKVIEARERVK